MTTAYRLVLALAVGLGLATGPLAPETTVNPTRDDLILSRLREIRARHARYTATLPGPAGSGEVDRMLLELIDDIADTATPPTPPAPPTGTFSGALQVPKPPEDPAP